MAYRGLSEHFRPGSHFLDDFNSERNNHAHLPTTIASKLVKIINSYEHGEVVFDQLFNKHFRRNQQDDIWRVLNNEDRNFTIDNRSSPYGFHGFEVIRVHTKLALCAFHCRQGRDGRNKKCDGQCGALHLCRTFLLKSNEACHFGRKGKCMFGHDFFSQHNLHLLRENNLDGLNERELRALFQLPLSRCKTTTPQVCKYYNNDRQKCTNRHCTSLHICSQFILQEQHKNCKKNHSFQDDQVRKTLDLFEIGGKDWRKNEVFEIISRFNGLEQSADGNQEMYSDYSDNESNYSERSSFSNYSGSRQIIRHLDHDRSQSTCDGCKSLKQELDALKLEMTQKVMSLERDFALLKSEVQSLKVNKSAQETSAKKCPISGITFN
ncbi:protein mono-ADP-ribosyltransferase PARP12 [Biomphalaria glabrata]|nr:protein mono-ADP-ribosyltransferase PARP12 [Biomphalaria glabrata]